jgi:GT2 family glycosyltransferase
VDLSGVSVVRSEHNLGVPGGRDLGLRSSTGDVVCFLDDDAVLLDDTVGRHTVAAFDRDPDLAAVSFRIVDEDGVTARRHLPRRGHRGAEESGPVATFLGGASAVRRSSYLAADGYWGELFYGHEELDLSWRLIDQGGSICYLADEVAFHPRTPIGRHAEGWWYTGRNRVWIARRNLPWPIAIVHVTVWLVLGVVRAPGSRCRRQYVRGWFDGWRRADIRRRPIGRHAIAHLARAGRLPLF